MVQSIWKAALQTAKNANLEGFFSVYKIKHKNFTNNQLTELKKNNENQQRKDEELIVTN